MTRNGGGHVCFFIKDNGNGTFKALGGNQNDEVNYSNMSWARTTYGMRPNGTGTPKIRRMTRLEPSAERKSLDTCRLGSLRSVSVSVAVLLHFRPQTCLRASLCCSL